MESHLAATNGAEELESVFDGMIRGRADGVLVSQERVIRSSQPRMAELALRARLPSTWQNTEAVALGGLMGYGTQSSGSVPACCDLRG
jgi:hypothetical protein